MKKWIFLFLSFVFLINILEKIFKNDLKFHKDLDFSYCWRAALDPLAGHVFETAALGNIETFKCKRSLHVLRRIKLNLLQPLSLKRMGLDLFTFDIFVFELLGLLFIREGMKKQWKEEEKNVLNAGLPFFPHFCLNKREEINVRIWFISPIHYFRLLKLKWNF